MWNRIVAIIKDNMMSIKALPPGSQVAKLSTKNIYHMSVLHHFGALSPRLLKRRFRAAFRPPTCGVIRLFVKYLVSGESSGTNCN